MSLNSTEVEELTRTHEDKDGEKDISNLQDPALQTQSATFTINSFDHKQKENMQMFSIKKTNNTEK